MKREQLVDAASELNDVLGLDPEIDLKVTTAEIRTKVAEAAELVAEDDELSNETQAVLTQLKAGASAEEGKMEEETEPKAAKKPRKAKAPKEAKAAKEAKAPKEVKAASPKGGPLSLRGRYEGSLKQYADSLMLQEGGITWVEMLEKLKPEAEKRGQKNLVRMGQLKRLATKRGLRGFKVEMDDERVKMYRP